MTLEIGLLLFILGAAIVLFSFEWVAVDIVALGVLLSLILTGLLPPGQAFAGFGSDTVILILGLLIMTASLLRTGVVDIAGRSILRYTGENPNRVLATVSVAAAGMSAFMSNTASTAFFLPIVIGLARRARVSASKLLMPLAFATILASSVTLIATSTNILVSGLITQYAMPPLGMFELAPVGFPIVVVGVTYMLLIGRRLIPDRSEKEELTAEFGLHPFLSEIVVLPGSPLAGGTLAESGLGRDLDLTVLRLDRGTESILVPGANTVLQARDVLLVEGSRENILKVKSTGGIDIKADLKFTDPDLETRDMRLVEVILLPRSPLIGRTLRRLRLREKYGLQVLAIHRLGETIRTKISQAILRLGDILLIQGRHRNIAALEADQVFRVLGSVEARTTNPNRAPIAIAIFGGAIAAATLELLSLPVAMLLGALLAFLTRCITPEEAYREVEWKVIILIGSMLALGFAMENTGTAEYLAGIIVNLPTSANPIWLLSGFFILTVLLTQPMSNQAAAVVVIPVAIQTALQLGLNPRTFAVMIAVAASTSFITPLEPACLMVYGPGRYRFIDFIKVGSLLTVLIYLIAILLVPLVWPFS
jgi:di/tricarboxylate transporter